jgi:hypothetical protein
MFEKCDICNTTKNPMTGRCKCKTAEKTSVVNPVIHCSKPDCDIKNPRIITERGLQTCREHFFCKNNRHGCDEVANWRLLDGLCVICWGLIKRGYPDTRNKRPTSYGQEVRPNDAQIPERAGHLGKIIGGVATRVQGTAENSTKAI